MDKNLLKEVLQKAISSQRKLDEHLEALGNKVNGRIVYIDNKVAEVSINNKIYALEKGKIKTYKRRFKL
jgi:hypothetical protein